MPLVALVQVGRIDAEPSDAVELPRDDAAQHTHAGDIVHQPRYQPTHAIELWLFGYGESINNEVV